MIIFLGKLFSLVNGNQCSCHLIVDIHILRTSMASFKSYFPAVIVLSILITGCDASFAEKPAEAAGMPPPTAVTSIKVKAEDIPVQFEFVGQVAGSLEVEVRSRITGIIEQRHYKEGSRAIEGQLLFTLDAAPFKAEYEQAQAAIAIAKAQKVTAEAQLKKAQRELKRVTPLATKQMLSQNLLDDAMSAVDIAEAQNAVSQAAIKQAEANLLSAEINLQYTRIKSPINGITGRALLNRGALVQAQSNSLLTQLVQINPVHVNFGIPENDRLRIRKEVADGALKLPSTGFVIDLLGSDGELQGRKGELDFEDYKVDNTTGNFAMRASIKNDDESLSPGQFVRVVLKGAVKTNAIALPQRAILDGPGGKYVYVASDGENGSKVALQKKVVPGEWVDIDSERKNYWIIRQGLHPGDEVVVDGVARIFFPGMAIQVEPPAANPAVK